MRNFNILEREKSILLNIDAPLNRVIFFDVWSGNTEKSICEEENFFGQTAVSHHD